MVEDNEEGGGREPNDSLTGWEGTRGFIRGEGIGEALTWEKRNGWPEACRDAINGYLERRLCNDDRSAT